MLKNSKKVKKIELRELEPLLRRKFGETLEALSYTTEPLLPPGENYGSTILKVKVLIRKSADAGPEELHLVAKMLPPTSFQRVIFDSPFTFEKERFFYEQLAPAYRQLELEFGVESCDVLDITPEFYGARRSLTDTGNVDDDAVLLMQNLRTMGYYVADRRQGLDLVHAKAALTVLARFHALGMATKQHKPDFFEIIKDRARCLTIEGENFDESIKSFLSVMRTDPHMSPFYKHLELAMNQETSRTWSRRPPEPWSTVVHADFWINNIMFRKTEESSGKIDVKFVDFQLYLILSPLRELVFFLMTNLQAEVMERNIPDLLDLYYGTFIATLQRLKCDTRAFQRDAFDARLKIDAFEEFPHCPYMIQMMSADVAPEFGEKDLRELMTKGPANERCLQRLRRCVRFYALMHWLGNGEDE